MVERLNAKCPLSGPDEHLEPEGTGRASLSNRVCPLSLEPLRTTQAVIHAEAGKPVVQARFECPAPCLTHWWVEDGELSWQGSSLQVDYPDFDDPVPEAPLILCPAVGCGKVVDPSGGVFLRPLDRAVCCSPACAVADPMPPEPIWSDQRHGGGDPQDLLAWASDLLDAGEWGDDTPLQEAWTEAKQSREDPDGER